VSNQAPPMNSHLAVVLSRVRSNSRQPTVRAGAIIVRYLSLDSSTIWNAMDHQNEMIQQYCMWVAMLS
jgi:hypothetical protein